MYALHITQKYFKLQHTRGARKFYVHIQHVKPIHNARVTTTLASVKGKSSRAQSQNHRKFALGIQNMEAFD